MKRNRGRKEVRSKKDIKGLAGNGLRKKGKQERVETKRKDETRSTVTLDTYDTITSMSGSNRPHRQSITKAISGFRGGFKTLDGGLSTRPKPRPIRGQIDHLAISFGGITLT